MKGTGKKGDGLKTVLSYGKDDFTKKFNLEKNDGYSRLDILQAKVNKVKFTTNKDPFYKNMLKAWSKLDVFHDLPLQSQYYYYNSDILGENGDTLPVYNCLAKLKIKQVKEQSFKIGKAGCIEKSIMLSSTLTQECLMDVRRTMIWKIMR